MNYRNLALLVLAIVILFYLFPQSSGFGVRSQGPTGMNTEVGAAVHLGPEKGADTEADYTTGVGYVSSASLIPKEVVATEDFGQFAPDKILSGQNYLDPRSQIGYPETIGGVLRNANRDFRSEPLNPRTPVSIFNLSTIPPDTMRPKFEITPEYQ
jgi:hypothetical protein